MSKSIKKVAIVGGSGQIGGNILNALVAANRFDITAITREGSNAAFAPVVTVKKGDYSSKEFFVEALGGQEVLIIALAFTVTDDVHSRLITAAAEANVEFVLLNEYGSDNAHPIMRENVPINAVKTQHREHVERLGKSSWIGIVNNPWYDYVCVAYFLLSGLIGDIVDANQKLQSLPGGFFGIDIKNKTATLYDKGNTKFNTTTRGTVGLAVARLLSLPVTGHPSLSDYKNSFVYVSSFHTSQREILTAVQKATSTSDADWIIQQKDAQQYIDGGAQALKQGDFMSGMTALLYGHHFKAGLGGDFESTKGTANKLLGLPEQEDIEEVTAQVVKSIG